MKQSSGFTVVELIVVIIVMGILLGIGVVGLGSLQQNARDEERRTDTENIARILEQEYPKERYNENGVLFRGSYPATFALTHLNFTTTPSGVNVAYLRTLPPLAGADVYAPDQPSDGTPSLVAATNTTSSPTSVAPSLTISRYVYQPLTRTNQLCTSNQTQVCEKFRLFYMLEDGTRHVIESKQQ
ncbi:prepilin-type N-terminal cleavage/methylation domain-containing protein [Candidatus Saccharibacteria bacterium]|nr:prepilin-type N-terminal cleavage/methylation domain-containing protein [Candidatus Saccharibacteria bacterium]